MGGPHAGNIDETRCDAERWNERIIVHHTEGIRRVRATLQARVQGPWDLGRSVYCRWVRVGGLGGMLGRYGDGWEGGGCGAGAWRGAGD